MTFKAKVQRKIIRGKVTYEIIAAKSDIDTEVASQGDYPEICLTVEAEDESLFSMIEDSKR